MILDFTDKTAIVTGAAHGFGRAISVALAERGASVWACDVLDDELRETALFAMRWSSHPSVGPHLIHWAEREALPGRRARKRLRVHSPNRSNIPDDFPYREVLFALRHHASP